MPIVVLTTSFLLSNSTHISKQEYSGKSIKQLAKNYFEGSFSNVVSYLVKENNISVEELESLLKQIKKQQNQPK